MSSCESTQRAQRYPHNGVRDPRPRGTHACDMTSVGETSVPTTTGSITTHPEYTTAVLEHLVLHGAATRSELASVTGLGRGAIAGLTSRLLEAGVLRQAGLDPSGDGRATPLTLSAADHVLVTTFLGADEAIGTVASLAGRELARYTVPLGEASATAPDAATALEGLSIVLARALASASRSGHPIADLTVLVDGPVVGAPWVVVMDARLGAEPVDVLGELRARTSGLDVIEPHLLVPITIERSANAAAMAEHHELPGIDDVLYIAGDTAVMASALTGGAPLRGAHGLAATFAHLAVVQGGIRCECGQRGCLATVASAEVVLERAGLDDFAAAQGRTAALDELVTRVAEADDRARWSWLDAALWIGRALQFVVPAVDPAVVVVGGYWSHLIGDIDTAFRANRPTIGGGALEAIPTIRPAILSTDAALIGARRQARERLVAEPLLLAG